MQIKNAARVLPDTVGAEISVVLPDRISGQPGSRGSVGDPNRLTNHSRTSGCAQSRAFEVRPSPNEDVPTGWTGESEAGTDIFLFYRELRIFANCSPRRTVPGLLPANFLILLQCLRDDTGLSDRPRSSRTENGTNQKSKKWENGR